MHRLVRPVCDQVMDRGSKTALDEAPTLASQNGMRAILIAQADANLVALGHARLASTADRVYRAG